jgi:hypothetical protein
VGRRYYSLVYGAELAHSFTVQLIVTELVNANVKLVVCLGSIWDDIIVMFLGAIVYGVHYTIREYLCTFLVAGGVSLFALFKVSLQ